MNDKYLQKHSATIISRYRIAGGRASAQRLPLEVHTISGKALSRKNEKTKTRKTASFEKWSPLARRLFFRGFVLSGFRDSLPCFAARKLSCAGRVPNDLPFATPPDRLNDFK
jgi:hypothetical protein